MSFYELFQSDKDSAKQAIVDALNHKVFDYLDNYVLEDEPTTQVDEDQLDEISKSTLGSYIKKASKDVKATAFNAGHAEGSEPGSAEDLDQKAHKRLKNVDKAVNKLMTKE